MILKSQGALEILQTWAFVLCWVTSKQPLGDGDIGRKILTGRISEGLNLVFISDHFNHHWNQSFTVYNHLQSWTSLPNIFFLLLELLSVPRNLFYVNFLKIYIFFTQNQSYAWTPQWQHRDIFQWHIYFSIAAIYFKDMILLEKQKNFYFLKLFQQNKQLTKAELLKFSQQKYSDSRDFVLRF